MYNSNTSNKQGKYYIDKRREMTMRMKPQLKLIENFKSVPTWSIGKGSGIQNYDLYNTLLYEKDDNVGEMRFLSNKFNKELSQFGTTHKTYMENVQRYVKDRSGRFIDKNVITEKGETYFIDKFSQAHFYDDVAWKNRSKSCMMQPHSISEKKLGAFKSGAAMRPYQPCGIEGGNVALIPSDAPAPPVPHCNKFQITTNCDPRGKPSINYKTCSETIPKGIAGYCLCADGKKTAFVDCDHLPFNCDDACNPSSPPPRTKPYTKCQTYVGTASRSTPLICLNTLDGECLPANIPDTASTDTALLATCAGDHLKLINNPDFEKIYGRIAKNCKDALNIDNPNCVTGTVCPKGILGAHLAADPKNPNVLTAHDYRCCKEQWMGVNGPTDTCKSYSDTIKNCGCDWTMLVPHNYVNKRIGSDLLTKYGAPYKMCWEPNSKSATNECESDTGCTLSDKGHCETKLPISKFDNPPPFCESRSYTPYDISGYGCANTHDSLHVIAGDLETGTDACDQWPGCRYVDFDAQGFQGAYSSLYAACVPTMSPNRDRQIYDAGEKQGACWPNRLPGGGLKPIPEYNPPKATCPKGKSGNVCSGNGQCNTDTGACMCNSGYSGTSCNLMPCPGTPTCSGNGSCDHTTGVCACDAGYYEADCSLKHCPGTPECTGHGDCTATDGTCTCHGNWKGNDCATPNIPCPAPCENGGTCQTLTGKCTCVNKWSGPTCSIPPPPVCPGTPQCSGNGTCVSNGVCSCHAGHSGPTCSTVDTAGTPSAWGACSKKCGGGTQTRTCTGQSGTGAGCSGPMSQACNTGSCCQWKDKAGFIAGLDTWGAWSPGGANCLCPCPPGGLPGASCSRCCYYAKGAAVAITGNIKAKSTDTFCSDITGTDKDVCEQSIPAYGSVDHVVNVFHSYGDGATWCVPSSCATKVQPPCKWIG